ncbi:hypothetical protein [Streptomyces sp. NPDC005827]|uniref:hypothetical protein n=1 Tax=Streptomyces sp. NPDC005827 TaxID=3157070 RepID=UPI0033CD0AD1
MRREPRIILIGPGDLARTVAMRRRCSARTLWSRLRHAPVPVHRSEEYGTVTAWGQVPDLATALPARRRRGFFRAGRR